MFEEVVGYRNAGVGCSEDEDLARCGDGWWVRGFHSCDHQRFPILTGIAVGKEGGKGRNLL